MEIIVGNRFTISRRIGGGSFGDIFCGTDMQKKKEVAIKLEPSRTKSPQLELEHKIYKILEGGVCVPHVYWYGSESKYNILVMDRLSTSLEDIFERRKSTFSLKTVLMLADQMLSCIEFVHKRNLVHRDIKPDNFMMGTATNINQVYIIDFGLSKRFQDPKTHTHIKMSESSSLTGTARYASINAMQGKEQSRRDDLESLGYVWLYFLRGSLPWSGIPAKTTEEKMKKITDVKKSTSLTTLCKGFPNEFVTYLDTVRRLRFTEEPNYAEYRRMFRDLFIREGYVYDCVYDWSENAPRIPPARRARPPLGFPPQPQPRTQPPSTANSPRESSDMRKQSILDNPRLNVRKPYVNEVNINSPNLALGTNINISTANFNGQSNRPYQRGRQPAYAVSNPHFKLVPKPPAHPPGRTAAASPKRANRKPKDQTGNQSPARTLLPTIDHKRESSLF